MSRSVLDDIQWEQGERFSVIRSLRWGIAAACMLGGAGVVGTFVTYDLATLVEMPLTPSQVIGFGMACALVTAFVVAIWRFSIRDTGILACFAFATGSGCAFLAPLFLKLGAGRFSPEMCFASAFSLVGLLVGFMGCSSTRRGASEPQVDEIDNRFPSRGPWKWSHALGWSVASAVTLGTGAIVGAITLRKEIVAAGWLVAPLEASGVGVVCGLVTSLIVWTMRKLHPRDAVALVLICCTAGCACGFLAPLLILMGHGHFPPEVCFASAFPLVGLLAGLVGYACSRRVVVKPSTEEVATQMSHSLLDDTELDEVEVDHGSPPRVPWNGLHALGWAVASAIVLGGIAMIGVYLMPIPIALVASRVDLADAYAISAACGVVTSLIVWGMYRLTPRDAAWLACITCVTACGCWVLTSYLVPIGSSHYPSEVCFVAAFVLVGLFAGFAGYTQLRPFVSEPAERGVLPPLSLPRPTARVLPVVVVSSLFVVAAIVGRPSAIVGWLVLSVGVLGLAIAWSLALQERRIRELEQRLAKLESKRTAGNSEAGADTVTELG